MRVFVSLPKGAAARVMAGSRQCIWTPLIPATMPPEKVEVFGEETPLGRAGQPAEVAPAEVAPAEVAPAFVFLASAESSYITGEVLAVTGGKPVTT